MYNKPMVFVALAYMCGIVLGRYSFFPWWICVFVLLGVSIGLFIPGSGVRQDIGWRKVCFCLGIIIIGYLVYQISLNANLAFSQGYPHRLTFLKESIRKILYYNFPSGQERNLVAGLFLGERYRISNEILTVFRRTNTMHILAISGLHVGFIGVMLIGVLKMVFVPRKTAAMIAMAGILLYVTMVGWRPPAFRSAVIFCILLVGWILDRPADSINSLFLAALIILLINPQALFNVGFQLSFTVVFGLVLMAPIIAGQDNYILKALSGSSTAWVSSLPLIAYYFRIISPVSILANLVVVPAIGIAIASGFSGVLLGQLYLPVSGVFNCINYYLLKWLILFIKRLSYIPGAYFYLSSFPLYIVFLSYAILGLIFFLLQKRNIMVK